jgi:hypothetical protein
VLPLDPWTHLPVAPRHDAGACDGSDPLCRRGHVGWERRATTDLMRVARIWERGTWDVGIACGPSGLLVVDTATGDPVGGEATILDLARAHTKLPATWTVSPPAGGLHRYFTLHAPLPTTDGTLGPHVRTVSAGGYVLAPPTCTDDGPYLDLITRPAAPLPVWITALLAPGRSRCPNPSASTPRRPRPWPLR